MGQGQKYVALETEFVSFIFEFELINCESEFESPYLVTQISVHRGVSELPKQSHGLMDALTPCPW